VVSTEESGATRECAGRQLFGRQRHALDLTAAAEWLGAVGKIAVTVESSVDSGGSSRCRDARERQLGGAVRAPRRPRREAQRFGLHLDDRRRELGETSSGASRAPEPDRHQDRGEDEDDRTMASAASTSRETIVSRAPAPGAALTGLAAPGCARAGRHAVHDLRVRRGRRRSRPASP
jgi:hypothetical protein